MPVFKFSLRGGGDLRGGISAGSYLVHLIKTNDERRLEPPVVKRQKISSATISVNRFVVLTNK